MDQAIYNQIIAYVRSTEDTLGSRSNFTPGNRTHPADAKKQ